MLDPCCLDLIACGTIAIGAEAATSHIWVGKSANPKMVKYSILH
jgi:hypothetical protein